MPPVEYKRVAFPTDSLGTAHDRRNLVSIGADFRRGDTFLFGARLVRDFERFAALFVPLFAPRTSCSLYASRSQSVIGASTSSRWVIRIMFANFDFDPASTLRTCGALSGRASMMQISRNRIFGRTKK